MHEGIEFMGIGNKVASTSDLHSSGSGLPLPLYHTVRIPTPLAPVADRIVAAMAVAVVKREGRGISG